MHSQVLAGIGLMEVSGDSAFLALFVCVILNRAAQILIHLDVGIGTGSV